MSTNKTVSFLFRVVILLALPITIFLVNHQAQYRQYASAMTTALSTNITPTCGASGFYVSSSTGNDSNPGTPTQPWQSLNNVNSRTFPPGTVVYFKAGDRWEGSMLHPRSVGTSGCPITYTSYGSGAKPVISGAIRIHANSGAWSQYNGTVWSTTFAQTPLRVYIDTAPVSGWGYDNGGSTSLSPGSFYYTGGILYVHLSDDSNPNNHDVDVVVQDAGFSMDSRVGDPLPNYVTVDSLQFERTYHYSIVMYSTGGSMVGNIISNNTVYQAGTGNHDTGGYYNTVMFLDEGHNFDGAQILNNTISWCGGHGNCINLQGDRGSPLVDGNDVSNWNHNGIDLKEEQGAKVSYNVCHDSYWSGGFCYYTESITTAYAADITWMQNVGYNTNGGAMCSSGDTGPTVGVTCHLYNNTFDNVGTSIEIDNHENGYVTLDARNNFLPDTLYQYPGGPVTITGGYNAFPGNAFSQLVAPNNVTNTSSNPGWANQAVHDYRLASGSPLIGVGQQNLVPSINDIGAFAFSAPSVTPTNTPMPTPTTIATPTPAPTTIATPTNTPIPTVTLTPTPTSASTNIIQNGSFENTGSTWLSPWKLQVRSSAAATVKQNSTYHVDGTYSAKVYVSRASTTDWYVQLLQHNLSLAVGKTYTISFWARAGSNRTMYVVLQNYSGNNGVIYFGKQISITTTWQQYTFTFTATTNDTDAYFGFNLANYIGNDYIDNVFITSN